MSEAKTSFDASPRHLTELLGDARKGKLQLPDFQRSWVWDEERIRSLIASISRGFPVGAIMTLKTGGSVAFKPRRLEGSPEPTEDPTELLLDGQQRLTSLYQVMVRKDVVETITPRRQKVKRWFYLDIMKCLDPTVDRDEAVVSVPESRLITSNFGRTVELDLSSREREFENWMYPLNQVLDWSSWYGEFVQHSMKNLEAFPAQNEQMLAFNAGVVKSFEDYLIPVIALDASTSKEAVCVVFEKVNTGGKPLDAFELITAMYAADGHELRKDWFGTESSDGRKDRFRNALRLPSSPEGVLSGVGSTDFIQAISLFHTRDVRKAAADAGKTGKDLPKVSATRQSLLDLPLAAYLQYQDRVERGFMEAAKFLVRSGIYRVKDLPYQSQVAPLAAILAELGKEADSPAAAEKIRQWYWNGVFGELYGSSTETRIARDFIEVVAWVHGGPIPTTVHEATVRADRLETMRMRLSAAYKGVNALLTCKRAQDFRTGQEFSQTIFFDDNVDIHHIFPKDWCKKQGIPATVYDSIINKTPISARTNRIIGGVAPSSYLAKLKEEFSTEWADPDSVLDARLRTHLIDPELLRADRFEDFMSARQASLVSMIEEAIGKPVIVDQPAETEVIDEDPEEIQFLGSEAI